MKQGNLLTTVIATIFAGFIVAYIGVQVWRWVYNPVQTVSAVYAQAEDSIELNGFIVREEDVVSAARTGAIEMVVAEGQRAGKGDIIAAVYADKNALESHRKVEELDKRISQINDLVHQGNELIDIETADKAVAEYTMDIMDMAQENKYDRLSVVIDNIKNKTLSREYIYKDKSGLNDVIKNLKEERSEYSASANSTKRIYAPSAGYFSHSIDGYENAFNFDDVENWTVDYVRNAMKMDAVAGNDDGVIGKVVSNYKWKYVALIDEEEVEYIGKTTKVNLKFDNATYPEVDAVIKSISPVSDGKAVLVVECTKHISDFTVPRFIDVELVLKSYKGLKVPREALRINEEGEMGVYCLIDSQVRFKNVEPVFEKDSYYIVSYDSASTKSLLLYDEIIVAAKELENRKVLK